jgi:hypothetical protein
MFTTKGRSQIADKFLKAFANGFGDGFGDGFADQGMNTEGRRCLEKAKFQIVDFFAKQMTSDATRAT